MSIFKTSCPGKTFIAGEYSALFSQKAIVLLTEPSFRAEFYMGDCTDMSKHVVPKHCTGFVTKHANILQNIRYYFFDPYGNIGGVGASSAEFLFFFRAYCHFSGLDFNLDKLENKNKLLASYHDSCWAGKGLRPSGVDLISQNYSGLMFIDLMNNITKKLLWPFPEVALTLVHTGKKLATHEHLEKVSAENDFSSLTLLTEEISLSLEGGAKEKFFHNINQLSMELSQMGLVASHTHEILELCSKSGLFYAMKGCGAMCSDVVLLLYGLEKKDRVQKFLESHSLRVIANVGNIGATCV